MNPHVMIGMPCASGSVPWATAMSLAATMRACERQQIQITVEGPVGCSVVTWARDVIVAHFLKSSCTHLFWIDSDIAWAPHDFLRLLAAACGPYDIIGGAYALKSDPPRVVINLPQPGVVEANGHGNVRVKSLPLGFTVCKRAVIEKLAAGKPAITVDGRECPDLFKITGSRGEDIAFFEEAAAAGFAPWLDPSVKLGHIGAKTYRSDAINALGMDEYAKENAV